VSKKPKTDELILAELRLVTARLDELITLTASPPPTPVVVDLDELVDAVTGISTALAAMMHAMGGQYAQAAAEEAHR